MGRMTQPQNELRVYGELSSDDTTVCIREQYGTNVFASDEIALANGKTELGALKMARRRLEVLQREVERRIERLESKERKAA